MTGMAGFKRQIESYSKPTSTTNLDGNNGIRYQNPPNQHQALFSRRILIPVLIISLRIFEPAGK
jgi:hypothetical protein